MSKKPDSVKLKIFTQSSYQQFEREIMQIFQAVKDGRMSFERAMRRLHLCKDDMIEIYWHVLNLIVKTQGNIRTLADYQQMQKIGYNVELSEDELQTLMIQRATREVKKSDMQIRKVSDNVDPANDDLSDMQSGFTLIDDSEEN